MSGGEIPAGGGPAPDPQDRKVSVAAPAIQLPKGGGAIRGIGEKFAANPVTGTGSMSVPVATSPGRSGFGPQLLLSYDSGAGNGPFGFGWSLSLPSITRKTDQGLPRYFDAKDSDVFVLSGAEDLVPVYRQDAAGAWVRSAQGDLLVHEDEIDGYRVRRYRPRIEGLFARIERWTLVSDSRDVHWRSVSKDNILTLYGLDANSRIVDPEDASRIFSWLICETRDDKGNAVLYRYKVEDGLGVDLGRTNERNRGPRNDTGRAANRYLKRIHYGNRAPLLDNAGHRRRFLDKAQIDAQIANAGWMFEAVFDYGEHDIEAPRPSDAGAWTYRSDPFSSYRPGFEVRTSRVCQRVLMFHHFPGEVGVGNDCLVRSTDFTYSDERDPANARNPVYTFLQAVTQTGYRRNNGSYDKRSLPPVEFEYSQPIVQDAVHDVDAESLENLPIGVDGAAYQWTDLHGEGIPGILTEHAGAWYYKRNLSPIGERPVAFAPQELVAAKPNLALAGGQAQFMDLAGDGQPDLVVMDGPMPGLYEHNEAEGWQPFRPFASRLNRDTRDPNLKFIDLDGDGHADVLITEDDAFVWHASLAEAGFSPARRVVQALDEEKGPRLVFADGTQSIYLADLSGDGLTDLVRLRIGEVCYWPNLGYGRFGAKIAMDRAPHFDDPDQFDHTRIRLADIDGCGTTDIIYLHRDGVRLYFNQSGNGWSAPQALRVFPRVDDVVSIVPTDLLGNGTACLVWSSPLPGDARRQMRYVDLMGGQKPHLLVKTTNNLGAETRVEYAPSTKFYLRDKRDGKPWITKLPFPVHVVERVEIFDHISNNRFVTRYAYHHGYFDGEEREFRGFGMVEQLDTEQFAALSSSDAFPVGDNVASESHVPPIHTKTWFHTGVYLGGDHVSDFFAGLMNATDQGEYFREPGLTDAEAREQLLPDTVLPPDLTLAEEGEACRALKGAMLRQEMYALDGSDKEPYPYTVIEQNFTIRALQPQAGNRHGVFFTHAREAINFHYERYPADPRIQHALTLEVDAYGNVLKEAAIGYGRRATIRVVAAQGQAQQVPNPGLNALEVADQSKQTSLLVTYTENRVTSAIEAGDDYRTPLPCETRTFELTGLTLPVGRNRFTLAEMLTAGTDAAPSEYEQRPTAGVLQKRSIEHVRTLYRTDDLGVARNDPLALLPFGIMEPLALPGESYKLAFTPGLLAEVYGGRVIDAMLETEGRYVHSEGDVNWWIPSGRIFFSPDGADTPAQELASARQHFFLPHRTRDPLHTDAVSTESFITYDDYDLLMLETRDPVGNRVTAGERHPQPDGSEPIVPRIDYRVLQPTLVTDPNRNRTEVAFDTLGMVVATAVQGKDGQNFGDLLEGFDPDPPLAALQDFVADPHGQGASLLGKATTRIVYDVDRYQRSDQPPFGATLARETHFFDPGDIQPKIQISFSYSDGFGREMQKKIQAEAGDAPQRGPNMPLPSGDVRPGELVRDANGKPIQARTPQRWVGNGRTVFNNKGKQVKQYEPFFSATHLYEEEREMTDTGVSPILFYDPVERVVATLHPNHTWEKVLFDPWRQESWDVSDTVLVADPKTDLDVGDFFRRLADAEYLPTWDAQRQGGALGPDEQTVAVKTAIHAETPTVAHADSLGRTFLTVAHNQFKYSDTPPADAPIEEFHRTRVVFDIEGNQRQVIDANERVGMRYDYDMLGSRIHQASMEAGERWMLNDAAGKPSRAWDTREHEFRTTYDALRRPIETYLRRGNAQELQVGRLVYGETRPSPEASNLRGKAVQLFDQAGVVTTDQYDFKGNLRRSQRQLAREYKATLDWSAGLPPEAAVPLEAQIYTSHTRFDALNRPTELTVPDNSVIRPTYNEANLLERVEANLRGAAVATPFITAIDYDAKGQRTLIDYRVKDASGADKIVRTEYTYDRETFRLLHLVTTRPDQFSASERKAQDLSYTYDPVGNITHIRDDAQQTIFFRNKRVEPSAEYTYDAIYRLIEATGREHLGQVGGQPNPPTAPDAFNGFHTRLEHPGNGDAMGAYVESYIYDAVGNVLAMQHRGSDPAHAGWTRPYTYNEPSLLEPGKTSNRLSSTTISTQNGQPVVEPYTHDVHGNMTSMPHLSLMQWDYRDQLQATSKQVVNNGGAPEITYYVYDAGGQRVRKVTERQAVAGQTPTRRKERIYLGGFEIYREYENDGDTVKLERETLHIMDDTQRIALVETRTQGNEPGVPEQLIRYQFGNHLGSASLELDEQALIISYEEYTPYGSTSYQAVRNQTETPKRYRYTGMERDEESGMSYLGRRYLLSWLGSFGSVDPDYINTPHWSPFCYASDNPMTFKDPTGKDPIKAQGNLEVNLTGIAGAMGNDAEPLAAVKTAVTNIEKAEAALKFSTAESKAAELNLRQFWHQGVSDASTKAFNQAVEAGKKEARAEWELKEAKKAARDLGSRVKGMQEYLSKDAPKLLNKIGDAQTNATYKGNVDALRGQATAGVKQIETKLNETVRSKAWPIMKWNATGGVPKATVRGGGGPAKGSITTEERPTGGGGPAKGSITTEERPPSGGETTASKLLAAGSVVVFSYNLSHTKTPTEAVQVTTSAAGGFMGMELGMEAGMCYGPVGMAIGGAVGTVFGPKIVEDPGGFAKDAWDDTGVAVDYVFGAHWLDWLDDL